MFIQVITGKVTDADGFRRQDQKWNDELRPGATGFLGSTAGTTTTAGSWWRPGSSRPTPRSRTASEPSRVHGGRRRSST